MEEINPVAAAVFKGHQYHYGDKDIAQNYEQAAKYYAEAAEKGNAEGIYYLAYLTDRGLGVKKDHYRAHKLYRQAAAQQSDPLPSHTRRNVGVAESEYELGLRYAEGIVVDKNLPIAADWYERAVEHGSDAAANNLANMYENGVGVIQNYDEAETLYTIAARRGDPNAMYSLAELALGQDDLVMARLWYERACEAGNINAQKNRSKFEMTYQEMQQLRGQHPSLFSKFFETKNNLLDSLKMYDSVCMRKRSTQRYDYRMLSEYAKNGSKTAERMRVALEHFYSVMEIILENENLTENQENEFVRQLSQCILVEHIVAEWSSRLRERCHEIIYRILQRCNSESKNSVSQIDENVRICYSLFNMDSRELICQFLDQCIQKYPKNAYFYETLGDLNAWLKRFDRAIYVFNRGLEIDPKHSDMLFSKAAALRLLGIDMNQAIKAYQLFIAIAPRDHRHMPDAYYEMGNCYFSLSGANAIDIAKAIYDKGKEAEKLQLPCFLPYESNGRTILEFQFSPALFTMQTIPTKSEKRLKDPHRIEVITEQRQLKHTILNNRHQSNVSRITHSVAPRVRQKMQKSLVNLKPISIREMDPRKDHVYQGYVLSVKIIEEAIDWEPSIHLIVEDESFDCERLYIYDFPKHEGEYLINKVYTFGSHMSVINPYLRIGKYGEKPTIRIDDYSSIKMQDESERVPKMCRCCGEPNAPHVCGKCHQARYCSKECQNIDWKTYKHNLICQNHS